MLRGFCLKIIYFKPLTTVSGNDIFNNSLDKLHQAGL